MKLRVVLAVAACKLVRFGLRLLKKGGTALPGRVALKICPELLGELSKDVKVIAVTGTNGKTTSCRMIEQVLIESGADYFANRSGANLIYGITAEFAANSTPGGRCRHEYAVIECDEAASKRVFKYISPRVILVTNIFRDQLDRYGEVLTTLENVKIGVKNSPQAIVCLNADCSMTASIAEEIDNKVVFYGVETEIYKERVQELSDASHCIHCMTEYEYDYVTYGHLGGFRCPKCGYKRPAAQVRVTEIEDQGADSTTVKMDVFGEVREVVINLPGGYNIYNAAGAVTAAIEFGFDRDTALRAAGSFACGFGRMEKFEIGDIEVRMILIKNPAGCNQVLNYLSNIEEETLFVCILNDNDCDGTDVSWIWDVNFEKLCGDEAKINNVICSGIRAEDMAVRLKYAGLPESSIEVIKDYGQVFETMIEKELPIVIMPTYSAMMDFRKELRGNFEIKDFWE